MWVLFSARASFLSVSSVRGRSGVGPPDEAPRAAPGSVCGPESHPGFYQQPRVQQATDPVLPRLVWDGQELRGPNDRRQPVPGRGEERVRQALHRPVPLPSRQAGGCLQGETCLHGGPEVGATVVLAAFWELRAQSGVASVCI